MAFYGLIQGRTAFYRPIRLWPKIGLPASRNLDLKVPRDPACRLPYPPRCLLRAHNRSTGHPGGVCRSTSLENREVAPQVLRTRRSHAVTGVRAAATTNTHTPRGVLHGLPLGHLMQQHATLWRPQKNRDVPLGRDACHGTPRDAGSSEAAVRDQDWAGQRRWHPTLPRVHRLDWVNAWSLATRSQPRT